MASEMALELTHQDIMFFQALTNGVPGLEIGTGRFPRFMSSRRAHELWRAGYVKASPHHFRDAFGGYPGLIYEITDTGRQALAQQERK